jgi:hypothetical protein
MCIDMSASVPQTDDGIDDEPRVSDEELRTVVHELADLMKSDYGLDLVTDGMYVQQLDNPLTEDCPAITVWMDGDVGSGATKATIIQKVLSSDVPVTLRNTCDGHSQVEFTVYH